jgi:hypothetical protein
MLDVAPSPFSHSQYPSIYEIRFGKVESVPVSSRLLVREESLLQRTGPQREYNCVSGWHKTQKSVLGKAWIPWSMQRTQQTDKDGTFPFAF